MSLVRVRIVGIFVVGAVVTTGCAATDDPAEGVEGVDDVVTSVAPTRTTAEVQDELREGCATQQLSPDEASYCQRCAGQSDASLHKTCSCSIKCTSVGVIKMCGCTTYTAGPTQ